MATFQRQDHCECFDFPCSWIFFRTHCREIHGWDPGENELRDCRGTFAPVAGLSRDKRLDQMQGNLTSLRDLLKEHVNQVRLKNKDLPPGVRGFREV